MAKGETTQTTVQSTAPSNEDVNPTLSKLLKGVQAQYDANPQGYYFNKSLYAGTGATTDNALSRLLSDSNNSAYSGGVQGAIKYAGGLADGSGPSLTETSLMDVAQGKRFGEQAPGYATLRNNLINDVTTNDLNAFNNSGMFGSDSNRKSLSEGLGNALAGLDYTNYQNDITRQERALSAIEGQRQQGVNNAFAAQQMLPGLYDASLQPGQTQLQVGQLMDADAQAQRQAESDLYLRKMGAPTDYLAKLSSILAGNAGTGGTNSTTTTPIQQPNPLQLLLGGGLGLAALL